MLFAQAHSLGARAIMRPGAAADVTPPTITSSATQTVAENAAFSLTLTANEAVTWTKTGGADQALFTLAGNTLTMTAKNFEAPADSDANNTYIVQVTATDGAGNATNQTITVTVTDVAETSFSTTDKAAAITTSNNNMTATRGAGSGIAAIRSNTSKTTGKWVVKFTISAMADLTQAGVGFANASYVLTTYLGSTVNDIAYYLDDNIWYNGGDRGTWTTLPGNDTVPPSTFFLAIDIDNKLTQASFNGTTWSTTVNPFDITTANANVFIAAQFFSAGDAVTIDTNPTGWTLAGFSNWG